MIDAFDIYNDFTSGVNTFQGGNWRFNEDFVRQLNVIYFNIIDRETKNARKSAEAADNVIAFLVSINISIPPNSFSRYAVIPLPKNYYRLSSVRLVLQRKKNETDKDKGITIPDKNINKGMCTVGKKNIVIPIPPMTQQDEISEIGVEEINDNQWAGCLRHLTKYPKLSQPKMVRTNGSFQIAPKTVSVVVFSYYITPTPIVVNVTYTPGDNQLGQGDEEVYTPTSASQLLLPITMKKEILWELFQIYFLGTREQFEAQFSNKKEAEK